MVRNGVTCLVGAVGSAGCHGAQNALEPASPQAAALAQLSWTLFIGAAVIFLLVGILLVIAIARGRRRRRAVPLTERQSARLVLAGGAILPIAVLTPLLIYSVQIGRAVATAPDNALVIEVLGHQWWWEIRYPATPDSPAVVTANEIHVPTGRAVRFDLKAADVIHSFWVPNLQGKTDLIPGRTNTAWFRADTPGVYRGQCAEYCGIQHAHMAFLVIAEPPDAFANWRAAQARPAQAPADAEAERGRSAFLTAGCGACHSIRGTAAAGVLGPDLTHIAARRTLAAATLPNTTGHLAGWIANPQALKRGTQMPAQRLAPQELHALVHYLQTLR